MLVVSSVLGACSDEPAEQKAAATSAGVVGGVMSVVFFPVIAALGAIGALVAHLTIVVEKKDEEPE